MKKHSPPSLGGAPKRRPASPPPPPVSRREKAPPTQVSPFLIYVLLALGGLVVGLVLAGLLWFG